MEGLICFFTGHIFTHAKYDSPMPNRVVTPLAIHLDGTISGGQLITYGFLHYGIVCECMRCGKVVDGDNGLPVLMPDFN